MCSVIRRLLMKGDFGQCNRNRNDMHNKMAVNNPPTHQTFNDHNEETKSYKFMRNFSHSPTSFKQSLLPTPVLGTYHSQSKLKGLNSLQKFDGESCFGV